MMSRGASNFCHAFFPRKILDRCALTLFLRRVRQEGFQVAPLGACCLMALSAFSCAYLNTVTSVPEEPMEEEEDEELVRTKAVPGRTPEVTRGLASRIQALRGGGQPLPESAEVRERKAMERTPPG